MKRLVYTFERAQPNQGNASAQPIVGDVIVAIAMASVGITGVQRRVDGSADAPVATMIFPNDRTLSRFNLRIERALAVRGVRITKIRIADAVVRPHDRRAVA